MAETEFPKSESQNSAALSRDKAAVIAARLCAWPVTVFDHLVKNRSRFAVALRRLRPSRRRVLSSLFAIALNVLLIAVIAASLNPPSSHGMGELRLVLAPSTRSQAVTIPQPPDVELPVLQMPVGSVREELGRLSVAPAPNGVRISTRSNKQLSSKWYVYAQSTSWIQEYQPDRGPST